MSDISLQEHIDDLRNGIEKMQQPLQRAMTPLANMPEVTANQLSLGWWLLPGVSSLIIAAAIIQCIWHFTH
jgi:hypothetical protein